MTDFDKSAFAASYDQINNVAYCGCVPQNAKCDSANTVIFNTGNRIDFSTLHFSAKNDTQLYRRTLVIAVPQYTEISSFTTDTLPDNVYLVSDIQALNKVVLVNSVQYRTDFHRVNLNFSKSLRHCLNNTVFEYAEAAELITDGNINYQLYPAWLYVYANHAFLTQAEPYNTPVVSPVRAICGFTDGIPCFNRTDIRLCFGINPNTRKSAVSIAAGYRNNIIDSVYGDMLNIYNCASSVNADIKFSIYSEQDSYEQLYLQRGVLLNQDCYTACAAQYGFIFINDITNEIYEPAMRDRIVEGYKELVYKPVKFRLMAKSGSDTNAVQARTVPPVADVQISNEREYYTVGLGSVGRWQVRKYSINDTDTPELIEDFGPASVIKDAYLEADGNFDYFAGDDHISLVTEGTPWLVVIRASDKHMYVKRVGADVTTSVLLDTDVEQASICRGWKSDKYDVDAGVIVAYRKADGVYIRVYHKVADEMKWDTAQQILEEPVEHVEVKRRNDFRIGIYTTNPNRVMLSDRYYIGGTSKTEYLYPEVNEPEFQVWSVTAMDGEHADLRVTNVELADNQRSFVVTCNYPFVWMDDTWNDISVTHAATGYSLETYYIENGKLLLRMNKAYQSPYVYAEFKIRSMNRIRFYRTPQSIPICPELTITYLVEANGYGTETLKPAVSNVSASFITKQRVDHTALHTETLKPNITMESTFIVKQRTDYTSEHTEILKPVATASGTFTVEQSGDLPV